MNNTLHLLIIETNKKRLDYISEWIMKKTNFDITSAASIQLAKEEISNSAKEFDVVLIDFDIITLARMEFNNCLLNLLEKNQKTDTPVVIFSKAKVANPDKRYTYLEWQNISPMIISETINGLVRKVAV